MRSSGAWGRWLMASLIAVALLAAGPSTSSAADEVPGSDLVAHRPHVEAQVQIPGVDINPTRWVQDAFSALLQSFSDGIRAGMDALWDANFITQTPPALTYQNGDIRALYGTMQAVANAALATIATVGALNGLLRPHFGLRYHSLSENGAHQALTDIVLGLVYVIVGLLLLLQMLIRLAWIDVLLVISPLAAACWVLPQTQGWAQTWNEQFTGAVFTQFVQVVALKLGGLLLVAALRLEPDVTWLSFLVGAATLWLTFRIPGLMRAGAGGNIADMLAKALMLRFALRGGGGSR